MTFSPLPRTFYEPSAEVVAPALLGHFLVRRTPEGWLGGPIVETEAYLAGDPACHAYKRETPRNRAMWGEEGRAYVYRIYGAYFCFNAVCRPQGTAEAVLVRALEPQFGLDAMKTRRPVENPRQLTSGPSKLCVAMEIGRALDGLDICGLDSPLIIAQNPEIEALRAARGPLVQTTRIGITLAADWPLRWYLAGSPDVSRKIRALKAPKPPTTAL